MTECRGTDGNATSSLRSVIATASRAMFLGRHSPTTLQKRIKHRVGLSLWVPIFLDYQAFPGLGKSYSLGLAHSKLSLPRKSIPGSSPCILIGDTVHQGCVMERGYVDRRHSTLNISSRNRLYASITVTTSYFSESANGVPL
jgi:hypothetical protein